MKNAKMPTVFLPMRYILILTVFNKCLVVNKYPSNDL